jgi:hypothetical protein
MKFFKTNTSRNDRRRQQASGHDILNSNVTKRYASNTNNSNTILTNLTHQLEKMSTTPSYNFDTFIGQVKGPTITIPQLNNVEPERLKEWMSQIRTLFSVNQYTPETAHLVLKMVTCEKLHHIFEDKKTIETKLDAIYEAGFPKKDFFIYENKLKNIRIEHYNNISEYSREFEKHVDFSNYCLKKDEQLLEREITGLFFKGLNRQLRITLMKQGIDKKEDAIDFIRRYEEFMQNEK